MDSTHSLLLRYHSIVSRSPSSNLCFGVQPSSRSIFEQSVGKDSLEVATVLEAQAASLQARGRGAEAAPLLKRAAEIRAAVK